MVWFEFHFMSVAYFIWGVLKHGIGKFLLVASQCKGVDTKPSLLTTDTEFAQNS